MAGPRSRRAGKTARSTKAKTGQSGKVSRTKKSTKSKGTKKGKAAKARTAKPAKRAAKKPVKAAKKASKASKPAASRAKKATKAAKKPAKKTTKATKAAKKSLKAAAKPLKKVTPKKTAQKATKPAKRIAAQKPLGKATKPAKQVATKKATKPIMHAAPIEIVTTEPALPGLTEADLRREVLGMPRPTMDLTHPDHVGDLMYLTCFRGRKFGRSRFARIVHERISAAEATDRFVANVPVELIALFFAREVRPVSDDRAPVNECFELPDGGLLEFVGDHMEAAETVARLLLIQEEARLDHVVELLAEHDRSWLHTLALEARDARLMELGFPDLDDVDRLFAPWHAQLLIRKLQASIEASATPRVRVPRSKVTAEAVLAFAHDLPEPTRQLALDRLYFLAICQAIHDTKRMIRRMTPDNLNQSAAVALRIIAQGIREAGGDMTLLAGPQVSTAYRLGLASLG